MSKNKGRKLNFEIAKWCFGVACLMIALALVMAERTPI